MNNYETVIILTPVLSVDQTKEAVKKFEDLITSMGGSMVHSEDWGLKKLAYPIQKKSTGFYFLLDFKLEGTLLAKFETELKRDERIMRFLTVKMDPDHLAFSEKRRAKVAGAVGA
jgi:small subunit ribosomal protein S6